MDKNIEREHKSSYKPTTFTPGYMLNRKVNLFIQSLETLDISTEQFYYINWVDDKLVFNYDKRDKKIFQEIVIYEENNNINRN